MKWLKFGGYLVLISIVVGIIYQILFFEKISFYNIGLYSNIIITISTFLLFIAFVFLGKSTKNKSLIIISWIILIVLILEDISYTANLINPYNAGIVTSTFGVSFLYNSLILTLIPGGIVGILTILLGISLFKIKNIKFIKLNAIFFILTGLFDLAMNLIIGPIMLFSKDTSLLNWVLKDLSSNIYIFILSLGIWLIIDIFKAIMFFDASKKLEK